MTIQESIARLTTWMLAHGAPLLAENLAAGASAQAIATLEKELGFPLAAELQELWSLHDGQQNEQNGFVGSLELLGTRRAIDERIGIMRSLEFLREDASTWDEAGVTRHEALSDQWVPIAQRDADSLVVNMETGRVFTCSKDSPPLKLVAASIGAWLAEYAERVGDGKYTVEEGFGDYFLEDTEGRHWLI